MEDNPDNLSVISLSSSSSKVLDTDEERYSPISLTSASSEGENLNGHRTKRIKSHNKLSSPQENAQKVKDWICSFNCGHHPIEIYDSDDNEVEEQEPSQETSSKTVCIRYDYQNTTNVPESYSNASHSPQTGQPQATVTVNNNFSNVPVKTVIIDRPGPNGKAVSSPPAPLLTPDDNKNEFCSYLQLMNPESKNAELFENKSDQKRRSARVKNLTLEQERSRIELVLKDKDPISDFQEFEKVVEDVINCPTLKAFEELNTKIDQFEDLINGFKQQNSHKMGHSKFMPLPGKDFTEKFEDFEASLQDIIAEHNKQKFVTEVSKYLQRIDENEKKKKFKAKERKFDKAKSKFKLKLRTFDKSKFRFKNNPRTASLRKRAISLETIVSNKRKVGRPPKKKFFKQPTSLQSQDCPTTNEKAKPPDKQQNQNGAETNEHKSQNVKKTNENTHENKESDNKTNDSALNPDKKTSDQRCEIVSVAVHSDDENIDLKNFVDDMLSLDTLSEEHRRSIIESRISSSMTIANLMHKGVNQENEQVQKAFKVFSEVSQEAQINNKSTKTLVSHEPVENLEIVEDHATSNDLDLIAEVISAEHDYASCDFSSSDDSSSDIIDPENDRLSSHSPIEEGDLLSLVPRPDLEVNPVNNNVRKKSLQRSLMVGKRYKFFTKLKDDVNNSKNMQHSISVLSKNGAVMRAFYQDFNLVVTQKKCVSIWTQSALGNILGAQNMWIPKGSCQRLSNTTYTQKESRAMIMTSDYNVAYVELWTKEHKSDVRQMPVADVFVTVYFWRIRQEGIEKKALQLENIKGFTDDVQYVVLRNSPKIIVSWRSVEGDERKTKIHAYHLAADFQVVAGISEINEVEHYVSSLHNVEDGDNLVMGWGEDKITLWNVEYGYVIATVELNDVSLASSTFWAKCDRGFLFTVQESDDHQLRLIAINGMNRSWKILQTYQPTSGFDNVKDVYVENGILVAHYVQGIVCWNAETGELAVEEFSDDDAEFIPSEKHVIMIANEQIIVRHTLSHVITAEDL